MLMKQEKIITHNMLLTHNSKSTIVWVEMNLHNINKKVIYNEGTSNSGWYKPCRAAYQLEFEVPYYKLQQNS
jgi:hypothetical protein